MSILKNLGLLAVAVFASATAFATPQYTGSTFGSEIVGSASEAGYYIWNDESSPSDWHIRWTGTGTPGTTVDWFGSIVFENSTLGTVEEFKFEDSGTYADSSFTASLPGLGDFLVWTAVTNTSGGVDGLDFSLTSDIELLEFNLGSSLFADLDTVLDDPGVAGTKIFVGSDLTTPDVLITSDALGKVQSFEIRVMEPGLFAMLGLGLGGLVLARRKQ